MNPLQDTRPLPRRANLEHPDTFPWLSIEDRHADISAQAGSRESQDQALAWLLGSLYPGPRHLRTKTLRHSQNQ